MSTVTKNNHLSRCLCHLFKKQKLLRASTTGFDTEPHPCEVTMLTAQLGFKHKWHTKTHALPLHSVLTFSTSTPLTLILLHGFFPLLSPIPRLGKKALSIFIFQSDHQLMSLKVLLRVKPLRDIICTCSNNIRLSVRSSWGKEQVLTGTIPFL